MPVGYFYSRLKKVTAYFRRINMNKKKRPSKLLHSFFRARLFNKQKLLRQIFDEAFYDRELAEIVSLKDYSYMDIVKGEVLKNPRYERKI